jgi:2-hydroxy-3-keto-5-methylthiopentenyl-1-phosphate phosphatase
LTGPVQFELSNCSIFLDFDGTISSEDVGTYLLRRFAKGQFEAIDDAYERGEIGSRDYLLAVWPLLAGHREQLQAVADEVGWDPTLSSLVEVLGAVGAELLVVSDGLGFYISERCEALGITVMTAELQGEALAFPFADPTCVCGTCGTCKIRPIRCAQDQGRIAIAVGDGSSDQYAASAADIVFAKDWLLEWCRHKNISCHEFSNLADVEAQLWLLGTELDVNRETKGEWGS